MPTLITEEMKQAVGKKLGLTGHVDFTSFDTVGRMFFCLLNYLSISNQADAEEIWLSLQLEHDADNPTAVPAALIKEIYEQITNEPSN